MWSSDSTPETTRGASTEIFARDAPVNARVSMLLSLFAIVLCGVAGALAAFALVSALGLAGVFSAIVAVIVGVVVATLLFALGIAALRALRWLK